MALFKVVRKSDGVEVYRYMATQAVEWGGMEFATHDHIDISETLPPPPPPPTVYGGRRLLTHLEFMSLFSADERVAIRAAGVANAYIFDFLELMKLAQEIDLDDPRTQVGVQTLEQMAVIAEGRAAEVLNG